MARDHVGQRGQELRPIVRHGRASEREASVLRVRRQLGVQVVQGLEVVRDEPDRRDEQVPYAFHHEFGFLTSCPTNVGTGVRASVLMHLPGLVLTKEIGKVLQGITQVGLTFISRGMGGV